MVSINLNGSVVGSLFDLAKKGIETIGDLAADIDDDDDDDILGPDKPDKAAAAKKPGSISISINMSPPAPAPRQTPQQTNAQLINALQATAPPPAKKAPVVQPVAPQIARPVISTPVARPPNVPIQRPLGLDEIGRLPVPTDFRSSAQLGALTGGFVNNISGRNILAQRGLFFELA